MTIYFNASLNGKKHYISNFKIIIGLLENMGHKVIKEHIINRDLEDADKQTLIEHQKDLSHTKKMIRNCDLVITEGSQPSLGVGYLVSVSLDEKKPVLILFSGKVHGLLMGDKNRLMILKNYDIKDPELSLTLSKFISKAKQKIENMRFNFLLSKEMNNFLKIQAEKKSISKASYIRNLIYEKIIVNNPTTLSHKSQIK